MNMRAFVLTRYGGSDAMELRDVPRPSPGPFEVLIHVYAAGLNPIDFKMRQGMMRVIYRYRLPIIAGSELSGVVVAKGSGVTRLAEGDRVFTRVDKRVLGAFAEFAVVREELVAKMPSSVDFTTAAGVPLAGLTALQALRDELRVTSGQNIFISGGSGGVGTFAIQLGKWLGAHIATTASARGEEMVRKAGPTLAALLWAASWRIRRQARKYGVAYRYLLMHPSGADLSELATLIDQQKLEVVIDRIFPFAHIADAFAYLEQGHAKGKVVVQMVEQL
jgi:NADPH:quinone reductase-like Zn-dependent oxidoreductase